ncbi:hypothetical protein [Nocardia gamkensis]|uniref:Uncharacterized protein n=1 Tax=Nocardia gamkensis TaxID=352869 RepID=A0A7X6L5Y6_9NOCA|nr:hypothetical protein [Nocardia gamkensis]NKY28439.1 hypothetical protein [Nocardia gamkensis]
MRAEIRAAVPMLGLRWRREKSALRQCGRCGIVEFSFAWNSPTAARARAGSRNTDVISENQIIGAHGGRIGE